MADDSDKNSKWSKTQVQKGKYDLKNLLLQWYNPQIKTLKAQGAESSFWDRQFNITKRSAHGKLEYINNKIDRYLVDYTRVSMKINYDWARYQSRLRSGRDGTTVKQTLEKAEKGPGVFYYYLVTVHLYRAWNTHHPGYEASIFTIWSKIGDDNRYLWNMDQLQFIMK